MKRRSLAALVAVVSLVSCGEGTALPTEPGGGAETSTTVPGASTTSSSKANGGSTSTSKAGNGPTTTGSGTGSSIQEPEGTSPLQRKQLPPGGVAEQYGVGSLAFTGGCLDITPAGTATRSITTGDRIRLCVEGLGAGTPTVEIVLPDGTTRAPDGNPGSFTWHARLRDPFGLYRITATVGSSTATASFRVDRPSGPTTLDGEPAIGPAGTTFSMGLAGFPANGRVQPDLYRYLRDEGAKAVYEFFTPLEPVVVDGRGEGLVTVATQAGDSPGRYCIKPRGIEPDRPVRPGGTGGCAGFEVRRA